MTSTTPSPGAEVAAGTADPTPATADTRATGVTSSDGTVHTAGTPGATSSSERTAGPTGNTTRPTAAIAPAGASAAIEVESLRKRYDGRDVVDGLSFSVQPGELFALLGPNGAGKTTTVEILEGYRRADGGRARVLGLDPRGDGGELRSRVGLMLQQGGIYPQARPLEVLRLFARFYAHPEDPAALLRTVGLEDVARTRYKVLSGGQKQRLGLALALIGRPEVAILDEPTAGMDPHAKATTRELIRGLRDRGVTVLLTTHELADVERLADRVAIVDRGRLVALGTMAELLAGAAPRLRFRLAGPLDPADVSGLSAALGGTVTEEDASGRYRLDGPDPSPTLVRALTAWCAERGLLLAELRTTGGTLEERYLELTGGTEEQAETGGHDGLAAGVAGGGAETAR